MTTPHDHDPRQIRVNRNAEPYCTECGAVLTRDHPAVRDAPTASTTPKRGPNTTPRTPQSNTPPKPPQTQKHTTPHTSPHTEAKHDPLLPGDSRTRQ